MSYFLNIWFYVFLLIGTVTIFSCEKDVETGSDIDIQTDSYHKFQKLDYYESVTIDSLRIQPYTKNPRYWQYKNEPVLLLGATDEDNLFNHPDIWPFGLESHLDLMVHNGGNYVRNTMSSRDHSNLWPFGKTTNGLYDLNTWDEEYWSRFKNFLELTRERNIIVQIELWDRFDYAREPWSRNPFNPKNNVNYNSRQINLPEVIKTHPGQKENPFFRSPPELENHSILLKYQEALIDQILSISLEYPHILYCISNESNESPKWSDYWAYYILKQAKEKNIRIHVTEMWDSWDLSDPEHKATFDKPDLYTFVDISQNNHQQGQTHWDNAQNVRTRLLNKEPRPINSVKIYGGTQHGGAFEEGTKKLWRNILGGFASSRYHRSGPYNEYGVGLSSIALTQIRSMRMLTDSINVFSSEPANYLLSQREKDEAYVMADTSKRYATYFPDSGSVTIDLSAVAGELSIQWLDIRNSEWQNKLTIYGSDNTQLTAPRDGPWVVFISK